MGNNYEKGKSYVTSLRKLAQFIVNMPVGKEYSFALEWDADEFVHDTDNCNNWYMFKKVNVFRNTGRYIVLFSEYGGGNEWCCDFASYEDNMLNHLSPYVNNLYDTTIEGYVCLDPTPLDESEN